MPFKKTKKEHILTHTFGQKRHKLLIQCNLPWSYCDVALNCRLIAEITFISSDVVYGNLAAETIFVSLYAVCFFFLSAATFLFIISSCFLIILVENINKWMMMVQYFFAISQRDCSQSIYSAIWGFSNSNKCLLTVSKGLVGYYDIKSKKKILRNFLVFFCFVFFVFLKIFLLRK